MTLQDILIVLNLIIIESLLSVDNAAVLAVMVSKLPEHQQKKALRYGIAGAYVFRGLCLLIASYIIKILWVKIVGGAYLLYLSISHFTPKKDSPSEIVKDDHKSWNGKFWRTVAMVELMDIVFSVDNIFAAVAMSPKYWVVFTGVAIGIVAMRFVAGWFSELMKKYPRLETSAYIVIALLGVKLALAGIVDYIPKAEDLRDILDNHNTDYIFSGITVLIFFLPLLSKRKLPEQSVNIN